MPSFTVPFCYMYMVDEYLGMFPHTSYVLHGAWGELVLNFCTDIRGDLTVKSELPCILVLL